MLVGDEAARVDVSAMTDHGPVLWAQIAGTSVGILVGADGLEFMP